MTALLAFIPIIGLLILLIILKKGIQVTGVWGFASASIIALYAFKMSLEGYWIALSKSFALAVYILLIIWASLLLYHLLKEFKAIETITSRFTDYVKAPFAQFLILAWIISAILQSVSGFGVPVIIVVPMLVALGYDPFKSALAVLFGHSWAVSFGSMGAAYYTLTLSTGLDRVETGIAMALVNAIAIMGTGIIVSWIHSGLKGILKGLVIIVPVTASITIAMMMVINMNLLSMAALIGSVVGLILAYAIYRLIDRGKTHEKLHIDSEVSTFISFVPYLFIIVGVLLVEWLPFPEYGVSFDYPAVETGLGFYVDKVAGYAEIQLFGHPAPILLLASGLFLFLYSRKHGFEGARLQKVASRTLKQGVAVSFGMIWFILMSLVMMDSGMTQSLANFISKTSGEMYLFFTPFVGLLGTLITGSNTNSNVLFGAFQVSIANELGANPYFMTGIQSIAGSIGVVVSPSIVYLATSVSGKKGNLSDIYSKVIAPALILTAVLGIFNLIIFYFF